MYYILDLPSRTNIEAIVDKVFSGWIPRKKDLAFAPEYNLYDVNIISFNPLYRLIFLACSIVALGTSGYFYSGCLLYTLMENQVLLVVLSAVRRSSKMNSLWMHH